MTLKLNGVNVGPRIRNKRAMLLGLLLCLLLIGLPLRPTTQVHAAGVVDVGSSTIEATPTEVVADGESESTVTVTTRDAQGNPVGQGGDTVTMETTAGTLSDVTDNGDGTYTATLKNDLVETATVSFTVNGAPAEQTATVEFVAAAFDPNESTIQSYSPSFEAPAVVPADGKTIATILINLKDEFGNSVDAGDTVELITDLGEVVLLTHNGGGTYQGDMTSTKAGTATVGFTVDGVAGKNTTTVTFTAGVADAEASTIEASPNEIVADGESESTVTVTTRDAQGNPVGQGGDTVTMETTAGTLSDVTDNGDGTYTATLVSTEPDIAEITFAINGNAGGSSSEVTLTEAGADPDANSDATADASPEADPNSQASSNQNTDADSSASADDATDGNTADASVGSGADSDSTSTASTDASDRNSSESDTDGESGAGSASSTNEASADTDAAAEGSDSISGSAMSKDDGESSGHADGSGAPSGASDSHAGSDEATSSSDPDGSADLPRTGAVNIPMLLALAILLLGCGIAIVIPANYRLRAAYAGR